VNARAMNTANTSSVLLLRPDEITDVVTGGHPGRTSDEEITYHANNNGTAASDLAIAQRVYEKCRVLGRGIELEIPVPGRQ
jgi:ornithine cyclodeaminase/alanine dehydrogenase-like protein (mu-crystallin family)